MMRTKKILIVEDERIIASVYSILLNKKGCDVSIAANVRDAINKTKEFNPDLIIMDIQLNEPSTGIDVARQIRADGYACQIIFTTGNLRKQTLQEVADITNCSVLIKPVEFSEIEKFL